MFITGAVLLAIMCGLYAYEWREIRIDVERQLLEKGSGLAIALSKSLQSVTEEDIKNGITLKNGTWVPGEKLKQDLFNDQLQLIPESEQAANKRMADPEYAKAKQTLFNGKEISLSQYELKYKSAYDDYTDERWQGVLDGFLVDSNVVFAIATAYSENPDAAGYIPTHNSKYSPNGDDSKDQWGFVGLLSQKYRANRVFNDTTGYNAAANKDTSKTLLQKYPRIIDGKVVETWDISYPLIIDGKHWGGVRVALSKEGSDALIHKQRMTILAGMALVFVAVLLVLFTLSRFIVGRRLAFMLKAAKNLNSHEADLTYRMPVKGKDEIGQLSGEINTFVAHLQEIVTSVRCIAAQAAAASDTLSESAMRSTDVSARIAGAIQEVAAGAENQASGAEDSAKAIEEMAAGVQRIAEAAGAVSEESQLMVKDAEYGNETTQAAVAQMTVLKENAQKVGESIRRLQERSGEIGEIAVVISGIAAQTNLLALNAAIEAARAGDQGRGFAIVAGEVRKLAEQSEQSAKHITELITELQMLTESASNSMTEGGREVAKSVEAVAQVGEAFERIVLAARNVSRQITDISSASEELSAGTEEVAASNEQMARIAQEASASAAEVADASQSQLALSKETSKQSATLSTLAQDLNKMIGKFIVLMM
jgi:methyl-accepting chemotaxis protein